MKNSFLLLGFALTFSLSAFAVRVIDVVVVRTAETNGSNPSLMTAAEFQKQIDWANKAYLDSGIQFKFDPVAGFPPVVNDSLLHRDWVLVPGQTMQREKKDPPKVDDSLFTIAKNNYIRKNYPNKLVVLSGAGNELKWDNGVWSVVELGGAYSNMIDLYVRWHKWDDSRLALFAHEGGHYLHLGHVFSNQPETEADFQKIVSDIENAGYKESDIPKWFDGDGLETAPDPGAGIFNLINGETCGNKNSVELHYVWGGVNKSITFNPYRAQVMSYFFCNNLWPYLSPLQKKRAANSVEFGSRNYLKGIAQGISIPRHNYEPALSSWGPGRLDLLVSGSDLKVLHASFDGNWWPSVGAQWENHAGESVGIPAIVPWEQNHLNLFVRDVNGKIKHQAWDGSKYVPAQDQWVDLGGTFAGDVSAVSWAKGRVDLIARGYDGNIYHKAFAGAWYPSQTGWNNMGGGGVTSDPVMVAWGPNRLDMFVRGKSGDLLHKVWDGTRWWPSQTEWESLGGVIPFGSKPAVTAWSQNRLDIFVRGTDNAYWHKTWNGSQWQPSVTGWNNMGGSFTSDPSMTSWSANRLDIVGRGQDGRVWHKAWDGSNWWPNAADWFMLGGFVLEGTKPKIISSKPGRLDIIIRNPNFELQHKAYEGSWMPGGTNFSLVGKFVD